MSKSRSQMRMEEHLKEAKPREFWIIESPQAFTVLTDAPKGNWGKDKKFHVIEYSAYAAALKEIARLKKENEKLRYDLEVQVIVNNGG